MQLELDGFASVVTGGSSGIGLETARLFLSAGASVAICGRDGDRLGAAEDELRGVADNDRIVAERCDVRDPAQVSAFAAAVEARFERLDILVNNAGHGRVSTFEDTDDDAWRAELDLKFFSIIHPTRAFLPLLERSSNAAIVCVSSLLARQPEPHMVATSAARAGALNMVYSMAQEFAPKGIRVNSVLVGVVDSGQWRRRFAESGGDQSWDSWAADLAARRGIPAGRLGNPQEVARAIAYLASPWASYSTGTAIDVSGGLSRHV
ncbi:MAG: SDR family oxidoreductase [Alphaproteobacteria bacterium]|nr:SDR family oxidoreductase [Alphaproteobacteria bacterium]